MSKHKNGRQTREHERQRRRKVRRSHQENTNQTMRDEER